MILVGEHPPFPVPARYRGHTCRDRPGLWGGLARWARSCMTGQDDPQPAGAGRPRPGASPPAAGRVPRARRSLSSSSSPTLASTVTLDPSAKILRAPDRLLPEFGLQASSRCVRPPKPHPRSGRRLGHREREAQPPAKDLGDPAHNAPLRPGRRDHGHDHPPLVRAALQRRPGVPHPHATHRLAPGGGLGLRSAPTHDRFHAHTSPRTPPRHQEVAKTPATGHMTAKLVMVVRFPSPAPHENSP